MRDSQRTLRKLVDQPDNVLILHYSCESFFDRADGRTPRITSIAVRNLATGQTHSFSIHKIAELNAVPQTDITAAYDDLEKEMLDEYFDFLRTHQGHQFVHWNMRDINFGFAAIEHRYRVLGGKALVLDDARKVDLSRLFSARFGADYIGHPRLETLMQKNRITAVGFLVGRLEADAFEVGDFVRLHQSTLRKVTVIANLLERAAEGSLQTDAKWRDVYGLTPDAISEWLKDHWIVTFFTFFATVVGFVLSIWKL